MESELSSVIDEPPKKRQKKQEKVSLTFRTLPTLYWSHQESTKSESTKLQKDGKTKGGKKKEALSKNEETINKLKVQHSCVECFAFTELF